MLEEVVVPEATSEDVSLPSLAARVSPVCDGTSLVSTVSPLRPSLLRETSLVVTLPEEAVGVPSPGLWPLFSEQLAATMTPKTHAALLTRRVEEPGTIKLGMEVCLISNRGIPLVAGCAQLHARTSSTDHPSARICRHPLTSNTRSSGRCGGNAPLGVNSGDMRGKLLTLLVLSPFLFLFLLCACERSIGPREPSPAAPGKGAFDDFTTSRITSLAHLRQMAAAPPGDAMGGAIVGTKFVIADFSHEESRTLHFLDGRFYLYHDEWAWFRLLNGQPVPAMTPLGLRRVNTPAEARRWAFSETDELPEGLALSDERLYCAEFYERALATPRDFGAGTLIYIPARPGVYPETWGFELEYSDEGDVDDVLVFFSLLEPHVPADVRATLKWITRSPHQAQVAQRLIAAQPQFTDRVMSYDAVTIPGETTVYNAGIVAGRLQTFEDLSRLSSASPDNILLLGALPEYLPQARGVLTAIPQTQLSHLNLLAKSRGIVNAYRGGLLDDPQISSLARSNAPVVLSTEDGALRFSRITEEQYAQWLGLRKTPPPPPRQVAWERAPYVVDLSHVRANVLNEWTPLIGGKSVGMVHLLQALHATGVHPSATKPLVTFDVPERPLAITVRAYREHLAQLRPRLDALLADPTFVDNRKIRILALEGIEKFEQRFKSKGDRVAARSYLRRDALGGVAPIVREGGLQSLIRKTPLPSAVSEELELISKHFAHYAPEQGLRFRSSSTVEDVEGSSGAGLYESFTGYLTPRGASPGLTKRSSLADALRKTWSSYFSVEAFEERHEAGVDHLAGNMGVLVHARFDDELEDANGVFTFTMSPRGEELLVDAQPGAVSVTNPPTDRVVRPESSRVTPTGNTLNYERIAVSSEATSGAPVLSDGELRELFALARRLTHAQVLRTNSALPAPQQRRSLVMDFEFRRVKAGWPVLTQGVHPPRFVVKQMRPLEPDAGIPADLRSGPIPRDVLSRTRRVEKRICRADDVTVEVSLVFSDPNLAPDVGYAVDPLFAAISIDEGGRSDTFTHVDHRLAQLTSNGLYVELNPGLRYSQLGIAGNKLQLASTTAAPLTAQATCETRIEFAAPTELLRSFLAPSVVAEQP